MYFYGTECLLIQTKFAMHYLINRYMVVHVLQMSNIWDMH